MTHHAQGVMYCVRSKRQAARLHVQGGNRCPSNGEWPARHVNWCSRLGPPAELAEVLDGLGLVQQHTGAGLAGAGQHRQRLLEEADVEHWQLQLDVPCDRRFRSSNFIARQLSPLENGGHTMERRSHNEQTVLFERREDAGGLPKWPVQSLSVCPQVLQEECLLLMPCSTGHTNDTWTARVTAGHESCFQCIARSCWTCCEYSDAPHAG